VSQQCQYALVSLEIHAPKYTKKIGQKIKYFYDSEIYTIQQGTHAQDCFLLSSREEDKLLTSNGCCILSQELWIHRWRFSAGSTQEEKLETLKKKLN
jgi:hypothetical protein